MRLWRNVHDLLQQGAVEGSTSAVHHPGVLKSTGAFVYKMNHHQGGCPTSGNGCDKKSKPNPAVLAEMDADIANGAPGLKQFFTTGSWQTLFPNLNVTDSIAYAHFVSGSYEARKTTIESTTTYLFGPTGFRDDNSEYMVAIID